MRVGFGIVWAVDAALKWQPGFRHHYLAMITTAGAGQPHWLSGWFAFWSHLVAHNPIAFAVLTALAETAISLSLLLGLAQRVGFGFGTVFAVAVWGVGEGFGGPYTSGSTDIGAAVMYAALFVGLWVAVPRAVRAAAPSLDHRLARSPWWQWATFATTTPGQDERMVGIPRSVRPRGMHHSLRSGRR